MRSIIFSAIFITSAAFATGKPAPTPQPAPQAQKQDQQQTASGGTAIASAAASAGASANSTSNGGAASSDNSVSFRDRLQAPAVFAPAVYASGPCNTGWSAGASAPGAGLSFGKSKTDPSCDRRELARVMTPLNPAAALKILCADPIAKAALSDAECVYAPPADTSKPTVVILEDDHTGLATSEQLKRAFEDSQGK